MDVEIIAHRGYSALAPENTLAAFQAAVQYQAQGVELDVQLSADRVPIVIHDHTLNRTTNGQGNVQTKTLKQLQSLDAGSWFSSEFVGEKIPTFKAVLDLLKDTEITIYAEIKKTDFWSKSDVSNFVQDIINQGWNERCIIASFDHDFLDKVRQINQQIVLGYHCAKMEQFQSKLTQAINNQQGVMLMEYHLILDNPDLIELSRSKGVDVVVWTVDDDSDWEKLRNLGIKGIITNSLGFEKKYNNKLTLPYDFEASIIR